MKDTVRYGLDSGFTTEEIASDVGSKYESILERFRRNDEDELRIRMIRLRWKEWEERMVNRVPTERNRCVHGVWSTDGQCNGHGKLGRKHAKVAA